MDPKLLAGTVDLLLLEVIGQHPSYGYQIVQTVFERSRNSLDLKEGSLYPALHRLERQKALASYWTEAEGRRRKYYKLTAAGRKLLAAKRDEWTEFAGGINGVLGVQLGMV